MPRNELRKRGRLSELEREGVLEEFRRSGLTQYEFASRAGISVSCLYSWMRRARLGSASTEPVRFLELPELPAPSSGADSSPPPYTVWFPGGLRVSLAHGFVPGEAEQLCRMVRSL